MPSSACSSVPRDLPPFPTRRSSDLCTPPRRSRHSGRRGELAQGRQQRQSQLGRSHRPEQANEGPVGADARCWTVWLDHRPRSARSARSEEHTSELQSRPHLVCRLLLAPPSPEIYPLSLHDALPIFARRLVEAGTRVVEVNWPKVANSDNHSWDVHTGLSKRMKDQSAPMLDAGLSGLITDLDRRGLLDRKSTRLNSSHVRISYAVFCLLLRPPRSTPFPYTTLFRSLHAASSKPALGSSR